MFDQYKKIDEEANAMKARVSRISSKIAHDPKNN